MKDRIEEAIDKLLAEESTRQSLERARMLIKERGIPEEIVLTYNADAAQWYTTSVLWPNGSFYKFDGFSWGYSGEGPHGLLELFKLCGVPIGIDEIDSWKSDHSFHKLIKV